MLRKTYNIILLTFLLQAYNICAHESRMLRLSNNDGLSNSSITTIFQDSYGLIWIGTWDGLNVYNGAEFESFRSNRQNSSCISNPVIRQIFEEDKGILWITTDYGINRFHISSKKFQPFYLGYKNKETFREHSFLAARNSTGLILAASYKSGIYKFNPTTEKLEIFQLPGINKYNITQLFFDSSDYLWIINDKNEIFRLKIESDIVTETRQIVPPANFIHLCYDKKEKIWLQYENYRLGYYSIQTEKFSDWNTKVYGELNEVSETETNILFATNIGLVQYDKQKKTESTQLNGIPVLSIYSGTQDILWVGTDSQGIFRILPPQNYFNSFTKDNIPELGNYAVRAIFKDSENKLWIGSKGGGLISITYLGATLQQVRKFTTNNGLINNSVLSLAQGINKDFWIGTDSKGLNYYSFTEKKIKSLKPNVFFNTQQIYSVYALLQSDDSTLWVGTSGNGLFKLTISRSPKGEYDVRSYKHYKYNSHDNNGINNNIIYSLTMEGDSVLWIATRGGGVNRMNIKQENFTAYKNDESNTNTISSNDVICLYIDQKKQIWAGTTAGLNLIMQDNKEIRFKRYTEKEGLANSNIHGILEDRNHHIWISTNKGISRMNTEQEQFVHYFHDEGLQDNEFSDGASLSSSGSRELYFGGVNGFSVFHPDQIGLSNYNPPLYLNSFKIDNADQPLDLNYKEGYPVSYKSNSLTFHFSILDYITNNKCEMAYKVIRDGEKQPNWIHIRNNRDIILSNLIPGNYKLTVAYTNSDNQWNKDSFSFPFQITPPWWKSAYAYTVYTLLIFLFAYFIFRFQKYRLKMRHNLELEKLETQKKEEIHQAKLRFFTNIAHEFSNSITLIYGPCERMMSAPDLSEKNRNYLSVIKKNAERMRSQIQQLMEFRKAETGHLSLHFEPVDIPELIKYTLDNFLDIADQKRIETQLNIQPDIPFWIVDRDALEKVIFNLISNAFKYTPENGKITIELNINEKNELCFSCTNSGTGIEPQNIPLMFNRFKVLDNFENQLSKGIYTRNGIGLAMCQDLIKLLHGNITVNSKINEYTTFTVTISPDNKADDPVQEKIPVTRSIPVSQTKPDKKSKNILVIDDQKEIRQFIIETLNAYSVTEAENGQEALEKISRLLPDLIICDVLMPVMDGLTFLQQIKSDIATKHIPVILLSSKVSVESQIQGLETGADMYLGKPFHPAHLQAAVERMLGNKEIVRNYMESPLAYAEQFNGKLIDKHDKEFMNKAIEYLFHNLDNETYNQDSLSQDLAISRVQLYRKIKKLTDRTPADFIRSFRLQEAEKLLRTTSKTVQEIMTDCGFRNKAHFYREFAKLYHATPKEYRKTILNENAQQETKE
ncbi:two-component regulator propeller domain-containing protein [Coprobacter sp.]